ncbi:MAG: excinuclease ABC subunit UvrB [bacterium]|nr:excinuclease ABC subunit UvrB [bacterium]
MNNFKIVSKHRPAGDQPKAIKQLVAGLEAGMKHQTLLGVTGSGKTFTVANVIEKIQKPTLVIAHNKTLAAQLCNEFREIFPNNSVNYFVSYYDYYQPEAYMPSSDTYIEKEAMINDEIDKLRHAATTDLLTRKDVIVVASVSCIYGLGAPEAYAENIIRLKPLDRVTRKEFARKLVQLQFKRTNADLTRGSFRLRGDNWEVMPPDKEIIYNFVTEGDLIKEIYLVDPVSRESKIIPDIIISPARHFITLGPQKQRAVKAIRKELEEQLKVFENDKKFLEAERLDQRTKFDLAMIQEVGYCHGIENYSRQLSGRAAGEPPETLLDYFRGDFLTIIDESHVTVPQITGMYAGDASRKKTLIEYGFRLPSAADNRPLKFNEFNERVHQIIYTSATPAEYEKQISREAANQLRRPKSDFKNSGVGAPTEASGIVEQIIRPTGLVDPQIKILPAKNQVKDLMKWIAERVEKKERVLVTTLTKKMAEDLSAYLQQEKIKSEYLHSDVKTMDRIQILSNLRRGKFDVLVGVNLLREGLDLPEVSLVAIMDADKEGFLRSDTALIQTIGRAARNVNGLVLLYADHMTGSLTRAIGETERRRTIQLAYNKKHGITPKTIERAIHDITEELMSKRKDIAAVLKLDLSAIKGKKIEDIIKEKEKSMKEASGELDFELAAILRDEIKILSKDLNKERKSIGTKSKPSSNFTARITR